MKLSDFMKLPEKVRRLHIDLSTSCQFLEEKSDSTKMRRVRKEILRFLHLENDVPSWNEKRVCIRHLCECGTGKGFCHNPLHLVVGTRKENSGDVKGEDRKKWGRKPGTWKMGEEQKAFLSKFKTEWWDNT